MGQTYWDRGIIDFRGTLPLEEDGVYDGVLPVKKTLGTLMILALWGGASPGEKPDPVDVGLEERVEVQIVLVDVLVLDRDGRTVPGLSIDDFELLVGGKPVEIATLDGRCPLGAADDATVGQKAKAPPALAGPSDLGRIVLVFDYFHMDSADPFGGLHLQGPRALHAATEALESQRLAGDEFMIVSLGDVMRIETPFTADRDEVRRSLDRMAGDPALLRGPRGLTEFRFFDRLLALLDLMESIPGRKAIVLFSGPLRPDGFTHDPAYARISAMAASSRTAIYPVDTGGLRSPFDPDSYPLGGPPMLRRLASETGGRMTADTNDIALGLARARRDLACVYTLGFHDTWPRPDRNRRLTVLLPDKRGLRAIYPDSYVVRSKAERGRSLLETASIAPKSFLSDSLHADLVLSPAHTARRWNANLVVEIAPDLPAPDPTGAGRELRGFLRTPSGTTVHSFKRRIESSQGNAILESIRIRPGRYVLSAVLSDPDGEAPLATLREVVVPEIPRPARRGASARQRSRTATARM